MEQELIDNRELILKGFRDFNRGDFTACHDAFETLWMSTRNGARRFFQGMIQAAVGINDGLSGNLRGAAAQLDKSLTKLDEYPEDFAGINLYEFRRQLHALHNSVRRSLLDNVDFFDASLIPMIASITEDSLLVLEW